MQDDLYTLYVQALQEFTSNKICARELFYRFRLLFCRTA
jgi:hypothetical protein